MAGDRRDRGDSIRQVQPTLKVIDAPLEKPVQ